jgi:tape measure domain-containing protein
MESSRIAARRELMSRGIGNILQNQTLPNAIMQRQSNLAILSPFQATDLQQAVKRYIAAGATPEQAEWLTKRTGDIVAGTGGGAAEMERASLAFGKILSGGRMTGQEARELKDLGIPFEQVLQNITGKDYEGLRNLQKKGGITTNVVFKMVDEMTKSGGIFFNGMQNFSETFTGLMTSMSDMIHRAMGDFGDVVNDVGAIAAKFLVDNNIWNTITDWLDKLRGME